MKREWIDIGAKRYLDSHRSIFAVDSEVVPNLSYAVEDEEFLILRDHDMYRMQLHGEAAEFVLRCTVPAMAEEMAEIIKDMIRYNRGSYRYGG